jgi:hypothetical protein
MAPFTHSTACVLPLASVLEPATIEPLALMLVAVLLHGLVHEGKNPS